MTDLQAAAIWVLWVSGRFDTLDISRVVGVTEPDVVRLIDAARRVERGEPSWTPVVVASA